MEKLLRKTLLFKATSIDEERYIIRGVFSTSDEDRSDEVVDQNGWELKEYMTNPVILFAHDHFQPAIGKCIELEKDGNGNLAGAIQFAVEEYDFARTIFNLYKGGFMRAFSVGFMNKQYEVDQENDRIILRVNTLFEISCVNVPANAMALAYSKGIDTAPLERFQREQMNKAVVPYINHGQADEGDDWDGPAQIKACGDDVGKVKTICTWYDKDNEDEKSSYKLPHHRAADLKAVWKGVASAMGSLLGSRGGVDIPDGEKKAVYNHLAKHYKEFDKEVPEMKLYTEEELKQISESGNLQKNETGKAIEVLSVSDKATIRTAIKTLTEILDASGTDTQVDNKVDTPARGGKKISVKTFNQAIRQLGKARAIVKKTNL